MANPVRHKRLLNPQRGHRAAVLNGTSYLINANSGGALQPSGGFLSFACWVRFDTITPGVYHRVLYCGDGAGTVAGDVAALQIDGTTGKISVVSSNGSGYTVIESALTPTTNHWYYIIGTTGGVSNGLTIYDLNGELESGLGGTGPGGVQTKIAPVVIGGDAGIAGATFIGAVDSVGWWPGAIPSDLTDPPTSAPLWNAGKAIDAKQVVSRDSTHLAAFYNFDDPNGASTWKDNSGKGNDLTAVGFVASQRGAGY